MVYSNSFVTNYNEKSRVLIPSARYLSVRALNIRFVSEIKSVGLNNSRSIEDVELPELSFSMNF